MTTMNYKTTGSASLKPARTIDLYLSAVVVATALQRFGYYGIRSILIIYLTTEFGIYDSPIPAFIKKTVVIGPGTIGSGEAESYVNDSCERSGTLHWSQLTARFHLSNLSVLG